MTIKNAMIMPQATFCETNEIHFILSHLSIEMKSLSSSLQWGIKYKIAYHFQLLGKENIFQNEMFTKSGKIYFGFLIEFNYLQLIVIESN